MMDTPLLLPALLDYAGRWHARTEVAARLADGTIHRQKYGDLVVYARKVAQALVGLGVRPGNRVATLGCNSIPHFALFYAIPGLGAVCHTVNPRLPVDQIAQIVEASTPSVLLYDAEHDGLVHELTKRLPQTRSITMDEIAALAISLDGDFTWPELDERSAAMLCFTSGTTGAPKGATYSHRSLTLQALTLATPAGLDIGPTDTVMPIVPMYHVGAWGVPYAAPAMGAKLVLPGPRLDGSSLVNLMQTERVTIAMAVPTVWSSIMGVIEAGSELRTLRRASVGGAPLSAALADRFERASIEPIPGFGMTETSALIGVCQPSNIGVAPIRERQGRPLVGLDARIVDHEHLSLPHDGVAKGELQVRGHWVIGAYYMGAGADAFTDGWLRTGDIASIDQDGYVQIVDRLKDVIKSGGEWISPAIIECCSLEYPGVHEAVVVGVSDPKWDERPFLFVRGILDETGLRRHLAAKLAKWQIPDTIVLRDEPFPVGATGKILRATLKREAEEQIAILRESK